MVFQLMTVVMMAAQVAGAGQDRVDRLRAQMDDLARKMQPTVSLIAPLVDTDGSRRGPAITVTDTGERFFLSSPGGSCDASISTTEPTDAREGWRISTRIISRDARRSTTVAVEWQRMWSGGRAITNRTGAKTEVALGSGDTVHVDHLEISAPGLPCHGQVRALEIQVMGNVVVGAPDRPIMPPPAPMTMDAWLVHQTPAGVETTYALSLPFDPAESRFVFRTQPITSHDGTFYIDVDAAVRSVRRDDGSPGLWAGLRRMIQSTSNPELRVTTGSGGSVIDWGRTGDVISFDLPDPKPVGAGTGGGGAGIGGGGGRGAAAGGITNSAAHAAPQLPPLMGHKFSVRIRFTPAK
jgi:hypothetical protein